MQPAVRIENSKETHSSKQFQSKQLQWYTGAGTKTHKNKTPKTNCKVLPNLKYHTWINYT